MAQNPELALWRTVLALGLRGPDAVEWQQSDDFETVVALAGLDPDAMRKLFSRRLLRIQSPSREVKRALDPVS